MKQIIKTIKLENKLKDFFFSPLLKERYEVPQFTEAQGNLISEISDLFLMSGILLNSCNFNASHINLIQHLKAQKKSQIMRKMVVLKDLHEIAVRLNAKDIEFVVLKGWALNVDGIYNRDLRISSDIDLLVREDMLKETFEVLDSLGFRYLNERTENIAKYLYGRHFPPMFNVNNTKLELHWRVTNPDSFKKCPLTEIMLSERKVSRVYPHMYCPKIEATLAHIIYHGFVAHRMSLGPQFIFDLKAIFVFFEKKWPTDEKLLQTLGVRENFDVCKTLVELADGESTFSENSRLLIDQMTDNALWVQVDDISRIDEALMEDVRIVYFKRNYPLNFIRMIRNMRHQYQVTYFSIKFYTLLIYHASRFVKRLVDQKFWRTFF